MLLFIIIIAILTNNPQPVIINFQDQSFMIENMNGLDVPDSNNSMGYIDDYDNPVFLAHNYYDTGKEIKNVIYDKNMSIVYSNGTVINYSIDTFYWVHYNASAKQVYNHSDNVIVLQTCDNNDMILIIEMKGE